MNIQAEEFLICIGGFIVFVFLAWVLIVDVESLEQKEAARENRNSAHQDDQQAQISPVQRSEIDEPHANSNKAGSYEKQRYALEKRRYIIDFVAVLLLFGYTTLTYWLLRTNQEALLSVQRAFVFQSDWKVAKLSDPNTHKVVAVQFAPQWTNSGTTPTKILYSVVNVDWRPQPLPDRFDYPNKSPSSSPDIPLVLGPKATMSAFALNVPVEQLLRLQKGVEHVYFWGTATYWDVFNGTPKHVTEFCDEIAINGNPTNASEPFELILSACPHHNCADEYCLDYTKD